MLGFVVGWAVEAGVELDGGLGAFDANDAADAPAGEVRVGGWGELEFAGDVIARVGTDFRAVIQQDAG